MNRLRDLREDSEQKQKTFADCLLGRTPEKKPYPKK